MHPLNWPSNCARGVHLIVSGGSPSPIAAAHAVADAYAEARKRLDDFPRVCVHHDLHKTLLEYRLSNDGTLVAHTMWHYRLDHPDINSAIKALDKDQQEILHVFPDATGTNLAKEAFRRALNGQRPVLGITAPDPASAVAHLESIGVADGYLFDSTFLSRIDVLAEEGPDLKLKGTYLWPYRDGRNNPAFGGAG